jgi:hypothetical protein
LKHGITPENMKKKKGGMEKMKDQLYTKKTTAKTLTAKGRGKS